MRTQILSHDADISLYPRRSANIRGAMGESLHAREQEPPHDVLAAEEFPLGVGDPVLHHRGPVLLPPDPSGIDLPHDVLAAEEFAMPAPSARHPSLARRHRVSAAGVGVVLGAALGLLALALALVRARGRRR